MSPHALITTEPIEPIHTTPKPPHEYNAQIPIENQHKLHINCKPFTRIERFGKRAIDILGGAVGAILFLIALILLAPFYWFQKKEERGPIIYTQKRYGKNGKTFQIYKFRTMIVDSQKYWIDHPDVYEQYRANGNKLTIDPRVTKIGQFIRNKSLDELPQFLNVLKGEMSLVGPRPILEFEIQEYGHSIHSLWFAKPGITGHWTTNGRSKIVFPERANLELMYNQKHGLRYDIKCLFLTVYQILKSEDAY